MITQSVLAQGSINSSGGNIYRRLSLKKIFTEQVNLELGFESVEFGSAEKGKEKLLGKRCQNNSVQLSLDGGHQGSCP